jgi:dihydrofolate reductase
MGSTSAAGSRSFVMLREVAQVMSLVGTLDKPYDLLLGRKTYDIFAGYWPKVPAESNWACVHKSEQYVLTRGSAKLDWANSHKLCNIDGLKQLKAEEGPDIVLWGSSTLYPQLLDANLIDRFLLLTCPIVLGKGKNFSAAPRTP